MNRDEILGNQVINLLEGVGVPIEEVRQLVESIKLYYRPSTVSFIARMWESQGSYQERMRQNPAAVSAEEFIGHICNTQGNSMLALEKYSKETGEINKDFGFLLGAMLSVGARTNLFLGSAEANFYKLKFVSARKKAGNQKSVVISHISTNIQVKEIIDRYKNNFNDVQYRRKKFFDFCDHVAKNISEERSKQLSVNQGNEAYQKNVKLFYWDNPDKTWENIKPFISKTLIGYKDIYFRDFNKWKREDRITFITHVFKNVPLNDLEMIGDQRANLQDDVGHPDADSVSLKEVFITPEELSQKLKGDANIDDASNLEAGSSQSMSPS